MESLISREEMALQRSQRLKELVEPLEDLRVKFFVGRGGDGRLTGVSLSFITIPKRK